MMVYLKDSERVSLVGQRFVKPWVLGSNSSTLFHYLEKEPYMLIHNLWLCRFADLGFYKAKNKLKEVRVGMPDPPQNRIRERYTMVRTSLKTLRRMFLSLAAILFNTTNLPRITTAFRDSKKTLPGFKLNDEGELLLRDAKSARNARRSEGILLWIAMNKKISGKIIVRMFSCELHVIRIISSRVRCHKMFCLLEQYLHLGFFCHIRRALKCWLESFRGGN